MKNFLFSFLLGIPLVCFAQNPDTRGVSLIADPASLGGETYAVVIGISNYKEVSSLKYSDRDAKIFADYLKDKKGMALDSSHVFLFLNEKATLYNIGNTLSDIIIKKYKKGDQVIFFFAGHGDYDANILKDQALLLLYGAPKKDYFQNIFTGDFISTADLNSRFIEPMTAKGCRVLLIVDACHSTGLNKELSGGTEGGKVTNMALQNMTSPVKIYSCMANEYSLESKQWGGGRGLFSYILMEGLYGMADADNNKLVSFKELQRYLEDKIPMYAAPNRQNPVVRLDDPTATAAVVNEELLAAYKDKKAEENLFLAKADIKGSVDEILQGMDSLQRSYYKACDSLINLDEAANAYTVFKKFAAIDSTSDLSLQLRRNLSVALQVRASQILSPLVESIDQPTPAMSEILMAKQNLEKAIDLLGESHFFYKHLQARILFLDGFTQLYKFRRAVRISNLTMDEEDKQAVQNIETSIQLEPNAAYAYYYLGKLYNNYGMDSLAKYYTERYHELIPKSYLACNALGTVHLKLREYAEAENIFKKAIELKPDAAAFYLNLGLAYDGLNKKDDAIEAFKKGIELNPDFSGGYLMLGQALFDAKKYLEAKPILLKGIELKSNFGGPLFNLGCIYAFENDTANAMMYLDSAFNKGYNSLLTIQKEPTLDNVRTSAWFKTMLEKYFTEAKLKRYPMIFTVQ